MDLLSIAATFAAAIPVAFAAALFMRCVPAMFVAFMDRGDRTWPRGVQEEDPEAAWASRVPLPGPVRAAQQAPETLILRRVLGRVGPGRARRG